MHVHHLIVGEEQLPVGARVRTWKETGLLFPAQRRRLITRYVTHRWSGGAGLAPRVFRQLGARHYNEFGRPVFRSAHLCVDPDGTAYQFCNLDRLCAYEGSSDDPDVDGHVNASSVGVVAVNPGGASPLVRGVTRVLVRECIHGVDAVTATLTAPQLATMLELTRVICAYYSIPTAVPMEDGDVVARRLTAAEVIEHNGILGHYMLTEQTRGPGLVLMRAVVAMPLRGKDGAAE